MKLTSTLITIGAVLALMLAPVSAQQPNSSYTPDFLELEGDADGLTLEPTEALTLPEGGTVEFWVAPDWKEDPGYDPVIVSNGGEDGFSYIIAMTAEKDGVLILSGEKEIAAPFNFADGNAHHVAVSFYDDGTVVYVDGEARAFDETMSITSLPSFGLYVGTANGTDDPFKGGIGALRIWEVQVDPDVIATYAFKAVTENGEAAHPDTDYLIGFSDFENEDFFVEDTDATTQP